MVGPYRVEALVGSGGMGDVYRAHDARLVRDVAIKFLPQEFVSDVDRLRRFEQEARAAAALNHPNILSVHDVGTYDDAPYFVCELLDGETLRARLQRGLLSVREVADYGVQLVRGLAAAHDRGIVHRDVKPENLFITTDGRLKILDFGVAKALAPADVKDDMPTATSVRLTEPGHIVGTVPYMSPEQVRGAPTDSRSDIFAAGAVLFEMLTGRPAFEAASANETMSAVLTRDPFAHAEHQGWSRDNWPPPLIQVIRHCLEKDPRERFQSARDIAFGLEVLSSASESARTAISAQPGRRRSWMFAAGGAVIVAALAIGLWLSGLRPDRGAPAGGTKSIAALPLANLSSNPQDEYFADGMTDSLITNLAKTPGLAVIARAAVFRYKGKEVDPRKTGQELDVQYVVHGSVQKAEKRVRVNVRLVDVVTGYNVWAQPFDEDIKDVLVMQDAIARRIAEALRLKLSPADANRGARRLTTNQQAYDAYLQGLYYSHQAAAGSNDRAIEFLEQSVQADSEFALAQATLGSRYMRRVFYQDADRRWEQKAILAVEKALATEPELAEGYLARAQLVWTLPNGFPHDRAVADLKHAIALNPNLAEAYVELGKVYLHIGLLDKSIEANSRALRLDPENIEAKGRRIAAHIYLRECDTALQLADQLTGSNRSRADVLRCLGRTDEAVEALASDPSPPLLAALLARKRLFEAARQQIDQATRQARNIEELSHFHHAQYYIGVAYALMGDTRQALDWLKKATREGLPCYPLFERDPDLDSLRKNPEFIAFLAQLKAQAERFRATL
jgi:serine/threonine protein kinase/tetratricopeptide (TPR) repeat protein